MRRSADLSTELKVDALKRDLRMQRSATDEANLAIQRLQNHYESQLRNCENQIVEQEKQIRRYQTDVHEARQMMHQVSQQIRNDSWERKLAVPEKKKKKNKGKAAVPQGVRRLYKGIPTQGIRRSASSGGLDSDVIQLKWKRKGTTYF